ncbi:Cdkl4 [Symbiodinium necroappetens]|uniref:Cdkl4 protein n=1 Tax=Symbiodinium necroappetens TaxID=1628268 RepID=A0A812TGH0_9DINO|nr:Cdkl4 [Symbiodinium necroappetens]
MTLDRLPSSRPWPFRPTAQGALSYFVGNNATNDYAGGGGIPEDKGFAIASGDTWAKVLFFNDQISCVGDVALAQGYYYFTNAASKADIGVEYTFVYKKIGEDQLKIIVYCRLLLRSQHRLRPL